jgi:hypothetical protein
MNKGPAILIFMLGMILAFATWPLIFFYQEAADDVSLFNCRALNVSKAWQYCPSGCPPQVNVTVIINGTQYLSVGSICPILPDGSNRTDCASDYKPGKTLFCRWLDEDDTVIYAGYDEETALNGVDEFRVLITLGIVTCVIAAIICLVASACLACRLAKVHHDTVRYTVLLQDMD